MLPTAERGHSATVTSLSADSSLSVSPPDPPHAGNIISPQGDVQPPLPLTDPDRIITL